MAMKLAIYQRLLQLGVPVELEAGQGDWRADLLVGVSAFSTALAIEVQLTQQSAQRTYDRTAQRRRAGVPTLWLFGAGRLTGHLSADLLESTPVFVVRNAAEAARIASAVCSGKAFFDDLSIFKKTPARPLALRIDCGCGQRWLYPFGAILLPNRVSAEVSPAYASCCLTGRTFTSTTAMGAEVSAEAYLDRYLVVLKAAAVTYGLRLGIPTRAERVYGRYRRSGVWKRMFSCPSCSAIPATISNGLPAGVDITKCPVPPTAIVDARPFIKLKPSWRIDPHQGQVEPTMGAALWKSTFISPLKHRLTLPKQQSGGDPRPIARSRSTPRVEPLPRNDVLGFTCGLKGQAAEAPSALYPGK
ncbi:hypothetical protein FOB65_00595 (plasmid) [Pseudomonas oryzihabitans]|jgi:hypothetical protein|nr:hypothetical protein FOB65_00595 [Pseudomonas oryzihabitans]